MASLPFAETARMSTSHYSLLRIEDFQGDTLIEQALAIPYNNRGHISSFKFLEKVSIEASHVCAMHATHLKLERKLHKQKQWFLA